jgi:uncharacterized protein involved in exopolysaccharide biosynthesis
MLSLPPADNAARYPQLELVPKILNVFFKWKWLIVLCAFAVAVPAAVATLMKSPSYQVTTKVIIKNARTQMAMNLSPNAERVLTWPVTPQSLNSEIQILRSQDLLLGAIRDSNYPLLDPGVEDTPVTRERALQSLRLKMSFTPVPDSNVIEVSMLAGDSAAATRLLNALTALYLKKHATLHAGGDNTSQFFEQQVTFHRARLDAASRQLELFQEKDNIVSIGQEMELNLAKLTTMESAMKDLAAEIESMSKEAVALEQQIKDLPDEVTKEKQVIVNPEVTSMRTKLVDLERQRDELLQRYTPKSRFVMDKEAELATLRKAMQDREQTVVGGTVVSQNRLKDALQQQLLQKQASRDAAVAKRRAIAQEKKSYEARLDILKDRTFDLGRLRSDFDLARETYLMYEKKAEEARVSRAMDEEKIVNASIVQEAMQPLLPQPRGLLLTTAASGVGGLVLGIAAAFVLEFFNLTMKDEQDVERFLQVPVLATVRHF